MPWQTEIQYVYNSNKVLESVLTKGGKIYNRNMLKDTSGGTGLSSDATLSSSQTRSSRHRRNQSLYDPTKYDALKYDGSQCMYPQNSYELLDETLKKEEIEILTQIRKFCFPDLSNIINQYYGNGDNYKKLNKHYKVRWKHPLQSEKFTFVLTKSGGQRLFGHVRRLFSPLGKYICTIFVRVRLCVGLSSV